MVLATSSRLSSPHVPQLQTDCSKVSRSGMISPVITTFVIRLQDCMVESIHKGLKVTWSRCLTLSALWYVWNFVIISSAAVPGRNHESCLGIRIPGDRRLDSRWTLSPSILATHTVFSSTKCVEADELIPCSPFTMSEATTLTFRSCLEIIGSYPTSLHAFLDKAPSRNLCNKHYHC